MMVPLKSDPAPKSNLKPIKPVMEKGPSMTLADMLKEQQSKLKKVEKPTLTRKSTGVRFAEELAEQTKKLKKVDES